MAKLFLDTFLSKIRVFYFSLAGSLLLSFSVYFTAPVEFETKISFITYFSGETQGINSSLLNSIGSLGGFSLSQGGVSFNDPLLYPSLVNSYPFLLDISTVGIQFESYGKELSAIEFFRDYYKRNVYSQAVFDLKTKVFGIKKPIEEPLDSTIINVSSDTLRVFKELRDRTSIKVDNSTGEVTVEVIFPDRAASAEYLNLVMNELNDYVIELNTLKSKESLSILRNQSYNVARDYEHQKELLSSFITRNTDVKDPKLDMERRFLEAEYELAFSNYKNISQEINTLEREIVDSMPAIKVLNPAIVPVSKVRPLLIVHVFLSIFIASFISAIIIFRKDAFDFLTGL